MRQSATVPVEGAASAIIAFPLSPTPNREESLFRAAYGMGADAAQLERRSRPFLTEDEAWAAWQERRP